MCPVCIANMILVAAGATSSGGLTALGMSKFCRKKKTNQTRGNKMKLKEMEPETEVNQINNPRIIGGAGHAKLL